MGRAMIIICAATLISLGIVSLSTSNQGQLLTQKAAEYAYEMKAKNAAHTAIQIAMQNINADPEWIKNHDSEAEAWIYEIDGAVTKLYIGTLGNDPTANQFFEQDSLRIVSTAVVGDADEGEASFEATVSSLYLKKPFSTLVPPFTGALQIASENANISSNGSATISGTPPANSNCPTSKPALAVMSEADSTEFAQATEGTTTGEIDVNPDLSYQPTDELIARLANTADVQYLSGTYKGTMGTPENPGVFFVEGNLKLTGGLDPGYGILVIRSDATMEMEDASLSVAGNFEFNGLVIFENAYNFKGRGTPTINGSVLVGHTEEFLNDPTVPEEDKELTIDLSGNINIQYDCRGETYAKKAAAMAVEQHKYTRVVTFEETGFSSSY